MAADETKDLRPAVDPALVKILQGHHDLPTRLRLLGAWHQERYERQMRRCQDGWAATHDPGFVLEAQVLIDFEQRPPPPWLSEAIYDLATEIRAGAKEYATRAHNALIRRRRYEAVRDAKLAGMTWDFAYAEAAAVLVETPARGSADSMKAAYMEVARDIREGRGAFANRREQVRTDVKIWARHFTTKMVRNPDKIKVCNKSSEPPH